MAKLYFRYGTVSSAKTLNQLAVAHNYTIQGKKVAIVKPQLDTRFGQENVASRAGQNKKADQILDDASIQDVNAFNDVSCILVDEVQFQKPFQIDNLRAIVDTCNCPIICYGLRADFRCEQFPASKRLLEQADTIEEVKTTCYYCNKKAIYNLKQMDGKGTLGGEQIQLGCEELYHPVCSHHYNDMTKHCTQSPTWIENVHILPLPEILQGKTSSTSTMVQILLNMSI